MKKLKKYIQGSFPDSSRHRIFLQVEKTNRKSRNKWKMTEFFIIFHNKIVGYYTDGEYRLIRRAIDLQNVALCSNGGRS